MKTAVLIQAALASVGLTMKPEGLVWERASVPACFDSEFAVLCGAGGACVQDNPMDTSTIQSLCGVDCNQTYTYYGYTWSVCDSEVAVYSQQTFASQVESALWGGGTPPQSGNVGVEQAFAHTNALGSGADCFYTLLKRYRHCVDCCGS